MLKIKLKTLIEIFFGLILVSIPFFVENFKNPNDFKFVLNTDEKVFVLPDDNKIINDFIKKAEKSVDITIYLLSDNSVISDIKKLKDKNIQVRIILEKTPFGGGSSNYKVFNDLKNYGIDIKYSNPKFSLTHAKYIIVDKKEALIMTSNLTYAGLNKDRDFILNTSEQNIVKELNNVFENDFNYKKYIPSNPNLVISPDNSRSKIEGIIKSAKSSIYAYGENINDKSIESLLIEKSKNGVDIRLILPDSKKLEDNIPAINRLKEAGVKISNLKNPYQHAKIVIVDNSIMYLGSINFSSQSMDRNREIGIITLNKESIDRVLKVFNEDWKLMKSEE